MQFSFLFHFWLNVVIHYGFVRIVSRCKYLATAYSFWFGFVWCSVLTCFTFVVCAVLFSKITFIAILPIYQSMYFFFFLVVVILYRAHGWCRSFVYFFQALCVWCTISFRLKCYWPPLFAQAIDLNHCEPINVFFALFHYTNIQSGEGKKNISQHRRWYRTHVLAYHLHLATEQDVGSNNENICNLVSIFFFHAKLSLKFMLHSHLF